MEQSRARSKIGFNMLCILLLYMPFHYYLCEIFLKESEIDNILRDIVIVVLLCHTLLKNNFKVKRMGAMIGINCFILLFFAIISIIMFNYNGTFNVLRTYLIPCMIFYPCSQLHISSVQLDRIHRIIITQLALIAIYGFFQAFILGDDFLVRLGYASNGGYLDGTSYYIGGYFGYQRSVGTFVSPNICGVVLAIALCVLMFSDTRIRHKRITFWMIVIGLLATFSRSAILGFLCACFFIYLISEKIKEINRRKILNILIFAVLAVAIILLIDKFVLDELFTSMLKSSVLGVVSKTDTSAQKHITDLIEPVHNLFKHPFGLGFGNNGPMALEDNPNRVESSIYLMIYEVGIIFGLMYFVPYICVIFKTIKNKNYKYYVPATVCIVVFVTYILLPNVQTYEILFYSYLFIGLYYNSSIKNIYDVK